MKFLIISDTHLPSRSDFDIINFINMFKYDYLIHCWDFDRLKTYSAIFEIAPKKLLCVHWNSDEEYLKNTLPEINFLYHEDFKFWIVHSHNIYPRWDVNQLLDKAIDNWLDVLFYWHTHKKNIIKYSNWVLSYEQDLSELWNWNIYLVNPWSLLNWDYLYLDL